MSDVITTLLPKNLNELKAYSSAKSMKLTGSTWLNANESPYAKTFDVSLDNLNRYPDPQPQAVIDAYADYAGVSEENVLMTRGADEGIELLVRTFCEPGKDSISIFAPTYGMYKVTADTHNVALNVLSQEQLLNDDKTTISEACAQSKLVFICNPNNPTGPILPVEKIAEIDRQLGETNYEDYEIKNGMKAVWMNIHDAIAHNEKTIAESPKKGMSIERETFLLHLIAKEMI